ncbi:bifunctional UDP-N-acetylglucosamine diphosphorylase/glucosamine-1-phosphate N-acetyltransferase GlmU [Bartonella sp. DGB1]|uniref:bifunctional UDP-N-acetylglucosamine diphosphorylase/glucosamine-1-phosphate N-acetyltransferase GlmU n=1 Tax=Bartonella sp. DGB1 TaxID=3239807 RepID=UPI0035240BA7
MINSSAIILAAGEGTRMCSNTPKILHKIAGLPMINHVINTVKKANITDIAVIIGNQSSKVEEVLKENLANLKFFKQENRQGTAHAVLTAKKFLENNDSDITYIVYGDTPLIESEDLKLAQQKITNGADLVIFGFIPPDPQGYGRLIEENGKLIKIIEEKEADDSQKNIKFCNSGLMVVKTKYLLPLLLKIDNNNQKQEYYLTDLVELANKEGLTVEAIKLNWQNLIGINTKEELSIAESIWQNKKRKALMQAGVTLILPETIYFSYDTKIAADVEIFPHVFFGVGVSIDTGCKILSFSHIEQSTIGKNCSIGPYARLRPGSNLQENVKIGNFCEIKKANIAKNTKINHLSYIGDSDIGENVNIGAGVITCNYDGVDKWKTIIKNNVFIGSQSALIAPVKINYGAFIAAGSIITQDVPEKSLAIARSYQINKINKLPSGKK